MKVKEALQKGIELLNKNKVPTPELDARWLLEGLLHFNATELILHSENEISQDKFDNFRVMLERRISGEPLAYIQNEKDFYSRTFYVDQSVLIPRPETEIIIDFCKEFFTESEDIRAADFGSGSGCLAVTLAKEFEYAQVTALEISKKAIEVIKRNIETHKVGKQVKVVEADLNSPELHCGISPSSLDLVVANPPYIDETDENVQKEVRQFEPSLALFADDEGFRSIKTWSAHAIHLLKSRGIFLMEIGATQKQVTIDFLTQLNAFEDINCYQDLSGHDRVIYARKR